MQNAATARHSTDHDPPTKPSMYMKTKQPKPINLVEGGNHEWEGTDQFREKVREIVREITDEYSTRLLNERSWIKRLVIMLRLKIEIEKRINKLSSPRNLHAAASM